MKLGGFLLLVALLMLSSEVQELQAAVRPVKFLGSCVDLCHGIGTVIQENAVSAMVVATSVFQTKDRGRFILKTILL
ncbi:protein Wfdc21-like [Sus scrofa]|uniref:protein Wfdc21-like n=1 Tax=Sus scrofa TaxID=9823 RepID=UPI000A2B101C|nr:protein Wfdc21-like [Sus scrofa]